jgi:hydrogenase nickel incorporation protein HypA/HybF
MHELSYTKSILKTVVLSAENAGAHRVESVQLTIGEVRDIVDDLFRGCFQYLAKGTIASDAKIGINRVPLTLRCRKCGTVFGADLYSNVIACPHCKERDFEVVSGMEFQIDSIEIS